MDCSLSEIIGVTQKIVGLAFTYAAFTNLVNFSQVVDVLRGYRLLPSRLVPFFTGLLIFAEATIAITHVGNLVLHVFAPIAPSLLVVRLIMTSALLRRDAQQRYVRLGIGRWGALDVRSLIRLGSLTALELVILFDVALSKESGALLVVIGGAIADVDVGSITSLVLALAIPTLAVWLLAIPEVLLWARQWRSRRRQQRSAVA